MEKHQNVLKVNRSPSPTIEFYKKAATATALLSLLILLSVLVCIRLSFIYLNLIPISQSDIYWELKSTTDTTKGGTSSISIKEASKGLYYEYLLTENVKHPYVAVELHFSNPDNFLNWLDLSDYTSAKVKLRCFPGNNLSFHLQSYDSERSDIEDTSSLRLAEALVPCKQEWLHVNIDLNKLKIPEWWLGPRNIPISDQQYWLDKTVLISFLAARQGPINSPANVEIESLTLHGRDWRYIYLLIFVSVIFFGIYIAWLTSTHASCLMIDAHTKLQKDLTLPLLQELEITKENNTSTLFRYLAKEYANPEMSLDLATHELGINRNEINEILRAEIGSTFSAYINKIRLSEAAHLLAANNHASVSEIAYSVGYKNVTYFNTLFKAEYGCTPKAFRALNR